MTNFFEPINISATHIYHSALELSPLSSTVRRLYYPSRHTLFPRVVTGTQNSWDQSVILSGKAGYIRDYSWSPCGQFVATLKDGTVQIQDVLSSELLSTLSQRGVYLQGIPTYSPDGHSLVCKSINGLMVWDIQTGGVAKKIKYTTNHTSSPSQLALVGGKICGICYVWPVSTNYAVCVYDVTSGTTWISNMFQSSQEPYLWAHDNKSFQIMTLEWNGQTHTINISEVGSVLTKIKSFHVEKWERYDRIMSFSPTTYRISILVSRSHQVHVLNLQNLDCLLKVEGLYSSQCHSFSADGSLFAISLDSCIHLWKYTSSGYNKWRELTIGYISSSEPVKFSPTSLSILTSVGGNLQVWHLDSLPITAHPNNPPPLAVYSCCGIYMATVQKGDSTITITNLLSQMPLWFIDTGTEIEALALTGNVLSVLGHGTIIAWRLTEEGDVYSAPSSRRANHGDAIWAIPVSSHPYCSDKGQIVVIHGSGSLGQGHHHAYHIETGEVLEGAQVPRCHSAGDYASWSSKTSQHYLHYFRLTMKCALPDGEWPVSQAMIQEGWIKDPEGNHRIWIPNKWRTHLGEAGWFYKTTTIQLHPYSDVVTIVF